MNENSYFRADFLGGAGRVSLWDPTLEDFGRHIGTHFVLLKSLRAVYLALWETFLKNQPPSPTFSSPPTKTNIYDLLEKRCSIK